EGTGRSPVALLGALTGTGTFMLQDGTLARLDPRAFDAIIRAADQGLPLDAERVRDRMEAVLTVGGLRVPLAEGEFMIGEGQARLANTVVRAQGAEVAASGSLDFLHDIIDARVILSALVTGNAQTGVRPDIVITLKGPTKAPTRTLDATALASWLALRAVDQQAKRLDALESGLPANPADTLITPPAASPPTPAPRPPAPKARVRPVPPPSPPSAGPSWLPRPLDLL